MKIAMPLLIGALNFYTQIQARDFHINHNAALVLGRADFTTTGGSGPTGPGNFLAPEGISVDPQSGQIYVGDAGFHRILRFPSFPALFNGASANLVIGQNSFANSVGATAGNRLNNPSGIRIGPNGDLLVADTINNRAIVFLDAKNLSIDDTFAHLFGQSGSTQNTPGVAAERMQSPGAVIEHQGNLWVADTTNNRVLRFSGYKSLPNGAFADLVLGQNQFNTNSSGTDADEMAGPGDLEIGPDGSLWVADTGNNRVLRFANISTLLTGASATSVLGHPGFGLNSSGTSATTFFGPFGLAVTPSGRLYVAEINNRRVVWFENAHTKPNGAAADGVIGQSDFTSSQAATTRNRISSPIAISLDPQGRLYVADLFARRALIFAPSPTISIRGNAKLKTKRARLRLRGNAAALAGFGKVEWKIDKKGWRAAAGTSAWSARVKLKKGRNTFYVRVVDQASMPGNEARARIQRRKK